MNLQWKRQFEHWLCLMGCPQQSPALQLALCKEQDTIYLEQLDGRALISRARPVPVADRVPLLLRLLGFLLPEASDGLPMRAWLLKNNLVLSVTAPQDSGAELWFALSERQLLLLNRATYENHNAAS